MRTTIQTRPLTLRVPIATEEERAHFQRRLAFTGMLVFALSLGFFLVTIAILTAIAPQKLGHMLSEVSTRIHLLTCFAAGAVWLALRSGKRSIALLSMLDFVISVGICAGWSGMVVGGIPLTQRPEMIALLACSYTLVVRAALIPSTPARTAVLGTLSLAPIIVMTVFLYPNGGPTNQWAFPPAVDALIWAMLGVAATTVISYIIYNLRQEVRKAMRLGQYVLEDKIGEGGMGVVFRASHAMLRRPTAIKLLNGTASQAAERFEREVQITANLTHPNTVAVFDYGRTPDGVFYYAMEYLEGISLEDLVADYGVQSPRRVAHLILQMCGALNEAHAAGLVHRDIKPANVMLTERGGVFDVVKVLDFGLVKDSQAADSASKEDLNLSAVNTIMGTPHYMSPEAILEPQTIDGRADLYAVGASAYYLLAGSPVFEGTNLIEICSQHLHEKPLPPSKKRAPSAGPEIPKAFEEIVLACLSKQPADRPKDAADLAAKIRACDLGEWTQSEAAEWWANRKAKKSGPSNTSKRKGPGQSTLANAFGKTVAVALDNREKRPA